MPLYEYGCGACGKVSDISHRISDPPAVDCPVCGKPALSKLVSAAGFRLKGAGWYETDFKSDGKRNLAGDSSGDAKPSGDTGGKSDTKPDAKPDAKPDTKSATKSDSKPAPAAAPSGPGASAAST